MIDSLLHRESSEDGDHSDTANAVAFSQRGAASIGRGLWGRMLNIPSSSPRLDVVCVSIRGQSWIGWWCVGSGYKLLWYLSIKSLWN